MVMVTLFINHINVLIRQIIYLNDIRNKLCIIYMFKYIWMKINIVQVLIT
jgi:hypothetical protein